MKNALIIVALGLLAWFVYTRAVGPESAAFSDPAAADFYNGGHFSCDGRTYCSQMTSCAEAKYFLRNCPNVEMDGNNDGEPCESQWCSNSR